MELSERKLRILLVILYRQQSLSVQEHCQKNIISESVLQQLGTKWLIWRRWGF